MSIWGQFRAAVGQGKPKEPNPRPYTFDPYFDYRAGKEGAGTLEGRGASESAYQLLQKYLARGPGFTPDEQKAMYDLPADQTKVQEQGAIRRLSQSAAATGRFGAGGTTAGKGAIIGGGITTRAQLKQNLMVESAKVALQDRINQIRVADEFAQSRLAGTRGVVEGRNQYNMGLNAFDLDRWKTSLDQYNYDRAKGEENIQKIIMAAAGGCWVAEALFGKEATTTHLARYYVNRLAPPEFRDWYLEHGQKLAGLVQSDRKLREVLVPLFVGFARVAKAHIEKEDGRALPARAAGRSATA